MRKDAGIESLLEKHGEHGERRREGEVMKNKDGGGRRKTEVI